ncbi:PIR Superfamily Protein [Plasmodium ovale wallikeri]|uniref:PIR Superfamily Protein n=1 Tax=Plasmodium ovale wallikeri TaxID=864142 RepID=A0A1A8YGM5_PLAOA|nr:PIR Superfamily Protein [Plasmodium ovale wallikeri]SBT58244.1 PIR Superfamily Protein [Plasmodium ovale wallikeri]
MEGGFKCKFEDLVEENESLRSFYLFKFYEVFNNEVVEEKDRQYCSGIIPSDLFSEGNAAIDLCAKLRRNFQILSDTEEKLQKTDGCRYLKFWFNDQLISYAFPFNSISPIKDNWENIENSVNIIRKCDNEDIVEYQEDDIVRHNNDAFYVMEIIYEYLKNSNGISTDGFGQDLNDIRNEIRISYITDNSEVYKTIKDSCDSNSSSMLCKIYEKCKTEHSIELGKLENKIVAQIESQKGGGRLSYVDPTTEMKEMASIFSGLENSESSSSAGTIATSFIFVIMGILCILLILYKFTPFGSWIRPLIRRKKKIWENIEDENDEFLHFSEDTRVLPNNRQYKIAYGSGRID